MTTKAKVVKKSAPKSAAKERQVPSKAVAKRLTPKELAAQQRARRHRGSPAARHCTEQSQCRRYQR